MAVKNEQGGAVDTGRTADSAVAPAAGTYTKEQYLTSELYRKHWDIISALLTDGESYTKEKVARTIEEHLKKEAK